MLHLAGGVALGVDVGDLLELQRALERDRVGEPAPEEQEVLELRVAPRDGGRALLKQQRLAKHRRQPHRGFDLGAFERGIEAAAQPSEVQRHGVQRDHRGGHRLRARYRDLRAGARVDHAVGDARGLRSRRVADRQLRAALAPRLLHRQQRVHRLARLRDRDDERARVQHRPAVAELRGVVDLGGQAREALDVVPPDHRRVLGGAHPHQHRPLQRRGLLGADLGAVVQLDAVRILEVAPSHGVERDIRLLVDLLQHEVPVAPLDRRHRVVRLQLRRPLDGRAGGIGDRDALAANVGDLAGVEEGDAPRVREQRGQVRGDELLAVAVADHQPAGVPGARGHQPPRIVRRDHDDGVGALGLGERGPQCRCEVGPARERVGDEVREHLGVGLGGEVRAAIGEAPAQRGEVLDDAVVHHRDAPRGVQLRMRVRLGRLAVGCPARVPDAGDGRRQGALDAAREPIKLAGGASQEEAVLFVEERDAGGVVAAVLEPSEAFEEDRTRGPRSGVADDSAHGRRSSPAPHVGNSVPRTALPRKHPSSPAGVTPRRRGVPPRLLQSCPTRLVRPDRRFPEGERNDAAPADWPPALERDRARHRRNSRSATRPRPTGFR